MAHTKSASTLGPKDLEDVLASVRKTKLKLNKLSVMFNNTGAQGVGSFIAQDKNVKEVSSSSAKNFRAFSWIEYQWVQVRLGRRYYSSEAFYVVYYSCTFLVSFCKYA